MNSCENNILENTISYLYKISEILPHNLSIPKSYYASKSRILELKGQSCLPTKLVGNKVRCPRCCLNFLDCPPNVRLLPKRKKDRFTKKILKKIEDNEPLTNYQEKFKKILLKGTDNNVLVKTCQFCKKEIKTDIKFKDKQIKKMQIEHTPIVTPKKKKKKKDKFAGLAPSAVMSFNESILNSENTPIKKNIKQILKDDELRKKDEENKIKYNVIGSIENKKNKKKKKKTKEVKPVKSTKMKIKEQKEIKANKKQKNKIKNLLSTLDKPKAYNILSGFLQSL